MSFPSGFGRCNVPIRPASRYRSLASPQTARFASGFNVHTGDGRPLSASNAMALTYGIGRLIVRVIDWPFPLEPNVAPAPESMRYRLQIWPLQSQLLHLPWPPPRILTDADLARL